MGFYLNKRNLNFKNFEVYCQRVKMPGKKKPSSKVWPTFEIGDLVFAKVKGYPHWPARIDHAKRGSPPMSKRYSIFFFGTHEVAQLSCKEVFKFDENKSKYGQRRSRAFFNEGLDEIEEDPCVGFHPEESDTPEDPVATIAKSNSADETFKISGDSVIHMTDGDNDDDFEVVMPKEKKKHSVNKDQKKTVVTQKSEKEVVEPCSDDDIVIPAAVEKEVKKKSSKRKQNNGVKVTIKKKKIKKAVAADLSDISSSDGEDKVANWKKRDELLTLKRKENERKAAGDEEKRYAQLEKQSKIETAEKKKAAIKVVEKKNKGDSKAAVVVEKEDKKSSKPDRKEEKKASKSEKEQKKISKLDRKDEKKVSKQERKEEKNVSKPERKEEKRVSKPERKEEKRVSKAERREERLNKAEGKALIKKDGTKKTANGKEHVVSKVLIAKDPKQAEKRKAATTTANNNHEAVASKQAKVSETFKP